MRRSILKNKIHIIHLLEHSFKVSGKKLRIFISFQSQPGVTVDIRTLSTIPEKLKIISLIFFLRKIVNKQTHKVPITMYIGTGRDNQKTVGNFLQIWPGVMKIG